MESPLSATPNPPPPRFTFEFQEVETQWMRSLMGEVSTDVLRHARAKLADLLPTVSPSVEPFVKFRGELIHAEVMHRQSAGGVGRFFKSVGASIQRILSDEQHLKALTTWSDLPGLPHWNHPYLSRCNPPRG